MIAKRLLATFLATAALPLGGCVIQGGNTYSSAAAVRSADESPAPRARNVILFIGDGMGISTITAARIYAGQQRGLSGEEYILPFETFGNVALVKTYNTNAQVPDSAGTATAMHSGEKTRIGVLGIGEEAERGSCLDALANPLPLLGEEVKDRGLALGIVSTARITHATPASVYARSADRKSTAPSPKINRGRVATISPASLSRRTGTSLWAAGLAHSLAVIWAGDAALPGPIFQQAGSREPAVHSSPAPKSFPQHRSIALCWASFPAVT